MAKQTINLGSNPNKGDGDPLRTAFTKINNNFDELYAGQNTDPSNTAADLIPDADGTRELGSEEKRWADVYVKDFIYLNSNRIELTDNGTLLINGGPPAERQDTVGSVFADDSTVMVDSIAGKVVGPVDTTTVDADTITATSISGDLTGNVTGNVTGDIVGSVFADDSTLIIDGTESSINLDGTVKGHIIPDADEAYDIGSMTNKFRDLYLSGSTINLGGLEITNDGGVITFGGEKVVVEGGTGDVKGSVFGDDSTLLVDAVQSQIVGDYYGTLRNQNWMAAYDGFLTISNGGSTGPGPIQIVASANLDLSAGAGQVINANRNIVAAEGVTGDITGNVTGNVVGDVNGSLFGDDSTLLVDGVNSIIPKAVVEDSTNWDTAYSWGDHAAAGYLVQADILDGTLTIDVNNTGDLQGSVFGDDSTLLVDAINSVVPKAVVEDSANWDAAHAWGDHAMAGYQSATASFTGDVKGSVFADDSTLLVDGANGVVPTSVLDGDITNDIRKGDVLIESTTSPGSITIRHTGLGSIDIEGGELSLETTNGNLTITSDNYVIIDSANNGQIEIGRASGVGNVIIGNADNGTDVSFEGNVTMDGTFMPPMLTQAEVDALTPTLGMMIYNTTTGKFQGYAADANNDSTTGWADLH